MQTSESVKEIFSALSKAQASLKDVIKDNANPYFKKADGKPSLYADLGSVIEAMRKPFADNGLCFIQEPKTDPVTDKTTMTALIAHSSGEWIKFEGIAIPVKDFSNAQALKSGITLMRRAQLLSIVGLAEDDDDGNSAAQQKSQPVQKTNEVKNHAPTDQKIGLDKSIELLNKITKPGIWTRDQVVTYSRSVYKKDIPDLSMREAKEFLELASKRSFEEVLEPSN